MNSLLSKLTSKQQKGQQAEKLALHFLQQQGLKPIAQNFRCPMGEIDLIMQDCDTIVFVEVRHRARSDYGSAAASVTHSKQARVIKAATLFLMQKKWYGQKTIRFDVVSLDGALDNQPAINWIKQAFYCD